MAGLLDYLCWRGDLPFTASPVCDADLAALSQIAILDLSSCVPVAGGKMLSECVDRYSKLNRQKRGYIIPDEIETLFRSMAASERFGSLVLHSYVEDIDKDAETQFSALIADCSEIKARFVIFSGTDDTIVGWKENFNMLYKAPVAAQISSAQFLNGAGEDFKGKIYVFGHSKGGHLAMYSALHCDARIERKIVRVVNFDGPGFPEKEKRTQRFLSVLKKTETILPGSSVIGRLFEHEEKFTIVHSEGKGLVQHDVLKWQILGPRFVGEEDFDEDASGVNKCISRIISELKPEEREQFIEGIFKIFYDSHIETVTDLASNGKEVIRAYFKQGSDTRRAINRTLLMFLKDKYIRKLLIDSSKSFKQTSKKSN